MEGKQQMCGVRCSRHTRSELKPPCETLLITENTSLPLYLKQGEGSIMMWGIDGAKYRGILKYVRGCRRLETVTEVHFPLGQPKTARATIEVKIKANSYFKIDQSKSSPKSISCLQMF
ncbi:hypothetical protein CHARACLAT_015110 [Characodon lateralis]|uniref:Uncharacterized protein n=1 Tax=Characodon lateralis TaxID=208331 RepID=A0ABU7DT08_9TELE|nr:hypothetical protein [Characodon lateralis]